MHFGALLPFMTDSFRRALKAEKERCKEDEFGKRKKTFRVTSKLFEKVRKNKPGSEVGIPILHY